MLESLFDNTPMQVSDLEEMDSHELGLMNIVRFELLVMGLIPSPEIAANRWKLKMFRWYQNIILCIYVPVMLGQILAIYKFWGDVDTVTDCAGTFFIFVACFFDYLYLIEHEKGIMHICDVLEQDPIPKVKKMHLIEKYLAIVEGCRLEIRLVMEFFWGLVIIGTIKWLIYNPVNELILHRYFLNHTGENQDKPNRDFVFIVWFPFDATWSPFFEIVYMFQSVLLVMAACHNICANSTFITFMVHAWGKLEMVESTISCIEEELTDVPKKTENDDTEFTEATITEVFQQDEPVEESSNGMSDMETIMNGNSYMFPTTGLREGLSVEQGEFGDSNIQVTSYGLISQALKDDEPFLYLVKCIKLHQSAIQFVHDLDDLISVWLAVRLFAFQMVSIGEVFQVVVNLGDWEQCSRHLLLLFMILSQILMYCWFGEQVIHGGWDVEHAVYCSTPWYTYSHQYNKHLVLVIMRAQRPVEITVGHYYSLSLQSCELILQNIYFFSMFLNQINNKYKNALVETEE